MFTGGRVTKRLTVFAVFLCVGSIAAGEVSTTVYLADANTPLELADPNIPFIYRDIMVGTKLAIIVSSDTAKRWSGKLRITGTDRDYGVMSARDYNDITLDWEGSHLEAAGVGAVVDRSASSLATTFDLRSDSNSVPGDWFVLDYTATNVGNCSIKLYESYLPYHGGDPSNPPPGVDVLLHELVFSHVPTRDFITDKRVDFIDFAALASFWAVANCADLNWCEGTDLDTDGDVDRDDLMLFADYWLESTE